MPSLGLGLGIGKDNRALFLPYVKPNIAARYSLDGAASDATYIKDGASRVQLVADRSGNSSENCLVLNGVAGNYASSPHSVPLQITGDIDIRVRLAMNDWTPSIYQPILAKWGSGAPQRAYVLYVLDSGLLQINWQSGGSVKAAVSTAAPAVADTAAIWIRATLDVDNEAGGHTVVFYTSSDGSTWSQLGDAVVGAGTTSILNSTGDLFLGNDNDGVRSAIRVYRAQVYSGISGTLVFDANFPAVSKLASSFAESSPNAATVTVSSSGDIGARICGARDLVQMTVAKQPIFSTGADGRNIATFDGSDDYWKSAPFSLVQPETLYAVVSSIAWTDTDQVLGGNVANSMEIIQSGVSPALVVNAGSSVASNAGLAVASRGVLAAVFNGAASSLRVNRGAAATGNAGTAAAGGLTVGAKADGSSAANITFCENILRSVADAERVQLDHAEWLMRKWGIQ